MIVSCVAEIFPGERRVALAPADVPVLTKAGLSVLVEKGAGLKAGFTDAEYQDKGAEIAKTRKAAFDKADAVLMVRTPGANPAAGDKDAKRFRKGQIVIGTADPLGNPQAAEAVAKTGATLFSLEMIPRITRAQSMDVLSSMATVAGYKAVLLAANSVNKFFPMLMTAAGTITPARVLVIGAGVAGLMAIAQAKRLGAVVQAYDVRPAVKEQVESLGGKFLELELETGDSEDKGGYAKAMGEEFYKKQRELMGRVVAECDVVITTAAIPGKKSPVLVTMEMVESMRPGSVVVDLAAAGGGNCEATKADEVVDVNGVTVLGPTNLPGELPEDASRMYSRNMTNFLKNMLKDGVLDPESEDEIVKATLICKDSKVVNEMLISILGKGQQEAG